MTLPEFQYPHQNAAYLDRLCRRILEDLQHDDLMDAPARPRRAAERDGWQTDCWDGR